MKALLIYIYFNLYCKIYTLTPHKLKQMKDCFIDSALKFFYVFKNTNIYESSLAL